MNLIPGLCLALSCFSVSTSIAVIVANPRSVLNRVMAGSLIVYAWWAFWASFVFGAGDPQSFWFNLRMAWIGYGLFAPCSLVVILAFGEFRPRLWFA